MSIKEIILLLSGSTALEEGFRLNPEAIRVYGRLIRSGIAEHNAQLFLGKAGVLKENAGLCFDDLCKRVLKEIMNAIEITDPFRNDLGQVVHALIGPTGVGKTTTIAKLAANLSLKHKRKVGLISIDNYRIGAVDQLGTYAGILGIPCIAAFNRAEFECALERLREKDVILVDTAGHGHYDAERVEGLRKLISHLPVQSHLVLSSVTNGVEMERAAENFRKVKFSSYVFTKTDETRARGVIINQILRLRMPISFVTTGQKVPDDIIKATKKDVLRLLWT
jgi:flagellar biosynthesis protein FlhF